MLIPNSIEKLTTNISPTSLDRVVSEPNFVPDEIISFFKKYLSISDYQKFEYGLVALKKCSNDKSFLLGLNSLFYEVLSNAIRKSEISEESKENVSRCARSFFDAQNTALVAFFEMLVLLNKNKDLLDARELSYIIIGYAISTIKKIHNT